MRQCYLFLLTLFTCLPAMAMTFQTRLENIEWKVEGDQFECRLIQPITDFGSGAFVRRAGEQAVFRLNSVNSVLGEGSATLLAAAAPWQPGRGDINLGSVRIGRGHVLFNSSQGQAGGLFRGLLEGRSPVVRHYSATSGVSEIRLLPVKFRQAYGDYQACTTKLLPRNFEQVRQSRIDFPGTATELDASALNCLNVILEYLKADPTVNHVILDGYSDNQGNRLTNRELSRRRALVVMEYFKQNGLQESQITVRFHGEQYPVAANSRPLCLKYSITANARRRDNSRLVRRLPSA